ncbi:hypothetical protein ACQPZ2_00920 [Nocardia pseudovaccinii]|uniref:hypothetical protein n=1 Tax=Nocardia pseudovaccinii TaxID=189540 RepID=UPI003D8C6343
MNRIMAVCLAVAATMLIAGCDSGDNRNDAPDAPRHTLKEFCDPLVEFFNTELHIEGFRSTDGPAADKLMEKGSYCIFSSKTTWSGGAWITPLRDDGVSVEREYREQHGYEPLAGHSAEVWIKDGRLKPSGALGIATEVGKWNGSIEVANGAETLTITDEQIGTLAELIIRLTRDMGN